VEVYPGHGPAIKAKIVTVPHARFACLAGEDCKNITFNHSPTMDFNSGYTITNSEHYINCDTLYASFQNLDYSDSPGNWTSSYEDYQCYFDDSDDWYFHLNSNSSSDVTQTSSSC